MSKIYVMVGLPGSGKSYYAENIENSTIFSSDKMREILYGDASIQGDPKEVFETLYSNIETELRRNKNAIIVLDATNLNRKDRRQICEIGKRYKCEVIAMVMRTPLSLCYLRNENRERVVPTEVIKKMVQKFEYPLYAEGFHAIFDIEVGPDWEYKSMDEYLWRSRGFDQHNIHHTADLYNHMMNAAESMTAKAPFHVNAALYHDVGKLFTQTGPDEDGNCHYFGHANWSAYLYLTSKQYDRVNCKLINYHMMPYLYGWKKFKKRFENEQGNFIRVLEILHDADVNAH